MQLYLQFIYFIIYISFSINYFYYLTNDLSAFIISIYTGSHVFIIQIPWIFMQYSSILSSINFSFLKFSNFQVSLMFFSISLFEQYLLRPSSCDSQQIPNHISFNSCWAQLNSSFYPILYRWCDQSHCSHILLQLLPPSIQFDFFRFINLDSAFVLIFTHSTCFSRRCWPSISTPYVSVWTFSILLLIPCDNIIIGHLCLLNKTRTARATRSLSLLPYLNLRKCCPGLIIIIIIMTSTKILATRPNAFVERHFRDRAGVRVREVAIVRDVWGRLLAKRGAMPENKRHNRGAP